MATLSNGDNVIFLSGGLDETAHFTEFRLADGRVLRVPTSVLMSDSSGGVNSVGSTTPDALPHEFIDRDSTTVIPIIEERLEVSRRTVPTGTVRLHKTVEQYEQALDEPLAVRTFDIERVILNQPVDVAPGVRHEGATTIYSLVEEQLILTKQLVLKEEVRVTQRDTERMDTRVISLRREHLVVEREPISGAVQAEV